MLGTDSASMREKPEETIEYAKGMVANTLATMLNLPFIPFEMAEPIYKAINPLGSQDPIDSIFNGINATGNLLSEIASYLGTATEAAIIQLSPFSSEKQKNGQKSIYMKTLWVQHLYF